MQPYEEGSHVFLLATLNVGACSFIFEALM